jgi:hypothetical protein
MLFEVKGEDNKTILESLEIFNREAEVEYRDAIKKAEGIMRTIGQPMPLSEQWLMLSWEQEGKVYVRIPLPMPRVIKLFRKHRQMENNLALFLESRGLKCKVQYKNEKEENEICKMDGDEKWSE